MTNTTSRLNGNFISLDKAKIYLKADTDPRQIEFAKILKLELLQKTHGVHTSEVKDSKLALDENDYSKYSKDTAKDHSRIGINLSVLKQRIMDFKDDKFNLKTHFELVFNYAISLLSAHKNDELVASIKQLQGYLHSSPESVTHLMDKVNELDRDSKTQIFAKLRSLIRTVQAKTGSALKETTEILLKATSLEAALKIFSSPNTKLNTSESISRPHYRLLIDPENKPAIKAIQKLHLSKENVSTTFGDSLNVSYKDNSALLFCNKAKNDSENISKYLKYQSLIRYTNPRDELHKLVASKVSNKAPLIISEISQLNNLRSAALTETGKVSKAKVESALDAWNQRENGSTAKVINFIDQALFTSKRNAGAMSGDTQNLLKMVD